MSKRKKKFGLLTLRRELHWTQDQLSRVLNVTRSFVNHMEVGIRRANDDLAVKISVLQELSVRFREREKDGSLEIPAYVRSRIQRRITALESKIESYELRLARQRREIARKVESEKIFEIQNVILEELQAPITMRRGLKSLALEMNVKRKTGDLDLLQIMEASFAGKRTEINYLKSFLENLPPMKSKK